MKIHFLKIVAALSFLFCFIYFLKDINLPFVGPFGNNNATYSIQARNYQKYGLFQTKFGPVNRGVGGIEYYLHHPPLLQLTTFLSYTLFGFENFWAGRFFPILTTLGSILLLYFIARDLWGEKEGYLALTIASLCPFLLSFGKLIQFEPWVLLFSLLFIYLWKKDFAYKKEFLFLISILGSLFDWTFLIFLFSFCVVYRDKRVIKYLLTSFFTLFLFFIYASALVGFNDLVTAYLTRSLGNELFDYKYPLFRVLVLTLIRIFIYFSPLVFLFSLFYFFKEKKEKEVLVFLLFGLLNIFLFLNGAFAHPYWLYFLSPFFILASSRSTVVLFEKKKILFKTVLGILFAFNLLLCFLVINYKDKQVKKALWQNDFINKIVPLIGENGIGVNWDFNEEFFRYKTGLPVKIYWAKDEILKDISENKWRYFVFSCWANCSQKDRELGRFLSQNYEIIYSENKGRAFLFDLKKTKEETSPASSYNTSDIPKTSRLVLFYRKLRDFLGVNQI